jgi:hypothetical protein
LLSSKGRLHLILSNTGTDDKENQPVRQSLHNAGIDIIDRFVPSEHIGHNKRRASYVCCDNPADPACADWLA